MTDEGCVRDDRDSLEFADSRISPWGRERERGGGEKEEKKEEEKETKKKERKREIASTRGHHVRNAGAAWK
jgi:hypothetical protein